MSIEFNMPSLGPDMAEGTLVEWRMAPGQAISRGDVVALVETEKGIIEIEAFHEGVVERLLVEPGAHVPVGEPLALFHGESPTSAAPSPSIAATAPTRVRISPAARLRAQALNVPIDRLAGSGAGGAITLEDVEKFATTPAAARAGPAMRHAIGTAMARAKREIPHYYLMQTLDFGPVRAWLEDFNARRPVEARLLHSALLVKAVAKAAAEVPGFNGYYRGQAFQPERQVHVGFAIAQRGGGLVAPAILDAANKDLAIVMREMKELVVRARTGHLRSSELASPTITVTSLGDDGVDAVWPIVFPDQVAILGAGRVTDRPWVVGGQVLPRPVLTLTLAADHRVSDGRAGAKFLARIAALLSSPGEL